MIDDVVRRSRSYRRFYQETAIGMDTLRELVDLARYSPSGGNLIFNCTAWLGPLPVPSPLSTTHADL